MNENTKTFDQLKEEIITLIANRMGLEPSTVEPKSDFAQDLGADSLDTVEMIMDLEAKYGVKVPDDDAAALKTVDDAVQFVWAAMGK